MRSRQAHRILFAVGLFALLAGCNFPPRNNNIITRIITPTPIIVPITVTPPEPYTVPTATPSLEDSADQSKGEGYAGEALCPIGIEMPAWTDCRVSGPSQYLAEMAAKGIHFPAQPLVAVRSDPELAVLAHRYARVAQEGAPLFATLKDARKGQPVAGRLDAGFVFVAIRQEVEVGGEEYVFIASSHWMRRADLAYDYAPTRFQGLEVESAPNRPFGWVLTWATAHKSPNHEAETTREFAKYAVIQVYDIVRVDDQDWYKVGPDQWLMQHWVGLIFLDRIPRPPEDIDRWISVDLFEQTLVVFERGQPVYATLVSSGKTPFITNLGLFQIYHKPPRAPMEGASLDDRSDYYLLENVPWTMYFDGNISLHGAYWHDRFGYPQSHGCVNLAPGDAHWLFDWSEYGDWVYVWDSSLE